jgi:hypothetical protein
MTRRREDGGLVVTDELLLAYLARPELKPPAEACAAEHALHAAHLNLARNNIADKLLMLLIQLIQQFLGFAVGQQLSHIIFD